jgi:hypothetical protein
MADNMVYGDLTRLGDHLPEYGPMAHRLAGTLSIRAEVFATALVAISVLFLGSCAPHEADQSAEAAGRNSIDAIAEAYVKLGLALGNHDPDYVDAYLGPPEWREEAEHAKPSLSEVRSRAAQLIDALGADPPSAADEMTRLRHRALRKNVESLATRVEMLDGRQLSFDEESRALFDAVAPVKSESEFKAILDELAHLLPGGGSLIDRYEAFRKQFEIPTDRLEAVIKAAIAECRARTKRFISLPEEESFVPELAAFKLDRMLGLGMIPVTVHREIGGQQGTLQFVPADTMTERERVADGVGRTTPCPLGKQVRAMQVFDVLIGNHERTPSSMLYSPENWLLVLIDHEKSFGIDSDQLATLNEIGVAIGDQWRTTMLKLDDEVLREQLGDVLNERRLEALGDRRDALIKYSMGAMP